MLYKKHLKVAEKFERNHTISRIKQNAVKVSQSKLGHPKFAHCSKMALILFGRLQLDRAVQTTILAVLDLFAIFE